MEGMEISEVDESAEESGASSHGRSDSNDLLVPSFPSLSLLWICRPSRERKGSTRSTSESSYIDASLASLKLNDESTGKGK